MAVPTLAPDWVLVRTDKGQAELLHHQAGIARELRNALIQVDGRRTVAQLIVAWSQWPTFPAALAQLLEQGYVTSTQAQAAATAEPAGRAARPAMAGPSTVTGAGAAPAAGGARAELIRFARSVLGPHAGGIVSRLERSGDDPAALRATVDACYKLVMLTIDEGKAATFLAAAKAILERHGGGAAAP